MREYTDTHEWVDMQGNTATIGITDRAVKEIGEIVFIELPKIGAQLTKGAVFVVLESTKAAIDICAPISGEVVEVNTALKSDITKLNTTPETDGWMVRVKSCANFPTENCT